MSFLPKLDWKQTRRDYLGHCLLSAHPRISCRDHPDGSEFTFNLRVYKTRLSHFAANKQQQGLRSQSFEILFSKAWASLLYVCPLGPMHVAWLFFVSNDAYL
jgi:hypothetical protein